MRLNPNAGLVNAGLWQGNSFYDALQFKAKAKIGNGAQIEGSYTWGKTIDTSSGSLVGDEYSNSIASPLFFAPKLNRGLADFNVAQNLEVNYTWEIGTPKWARGIREWPLSGWEIGGVFEASTGVPFTPGFGGDALGVKSTDSMYQICFRLRVALRPSIPAIPTTTSRHNALQYRIPSRSEVILAATL
jgi:hypothetical protein